MIFEGFKCKYACVCVCACVCVREREREKEREMSGEAVSWGHKEATILRKNIWVPSGTLETNSGSRYIRPGGYGGTYHMFTPAMALYSRQT